MVHMAKIAWSSVVLHATKALLHHIISMFTTVIMTVCPPGRYGLGCVEECTCETGNCHHITGDCSCPIGYFGANCSHSKPSTSIVCCVQSIGYNTQLDQLELQYFRSACQITAPAVANFAFSLQTVLVPLTALTWVEVPAP